LVIFLVVFVAVSTMTKTSSEVADANAAKSVIFLFVIGL